MKINKITLHTLTIPLIRPFITAVRRTDNVCDIVIQIHTDNGIIGYGSAASTPMITGDSLESITAAIVNVIAPKLLGLELNSLNDAINLVNTSITKNSSTKALVDMALHDIFAKECGLPLYHYLGGGARNIISTVITISVKDVAEMVSDAKELVSRGFNTLKLKVGLNKDDDLERIKQIRKSIPQNTQIIIDANQGWNASDAISLIKQIEPLNILFVEQPVKADDFAGLKLVHDSVTTPIIADESCFSPQEALMITQNNISNGLNIKLMKSGGITNANTIYQIAKAANLQLMVGCMLESPIGINAMASFALSHLDIIYADLDAIALIKHNPVIGGAQLINNQIVLSNEPGLGITHIDGLVEIAVIY